MSEKYIIDSHAHLDDEKFNEDREQIIENFEKDRVLCMINPSVDLESSIKASDLSKKHDKIFSMIGSHPHEAKHYTENTRNQYKKLVLENKKIVAVGEIGLDYHYDFSPRDVQREVFIDQIQLARKLNLPIVIHSREAFEDTYKILKEHAKDVKVLLHSFNETWEECQKYLDLGFYISLGGMITFKNTKNLTKVVENIPIDRVVLETDSPYLTPVPYRGRRNEPKYTHFVAKRMAEMRVEDIDYIIENINKNTIKFFGLEI